MKIILEKEELEWIAQIRNCVQGVRALYGLYSKKKIGDKDLIERVKKDFESMDDALMELGKRGV